METIVFIGLALALAAILYAYCSWHFSFWKKRGVPHLSPTPPFGTMNDLFCLRKSEAFSYHDHYSAFPESRFVGGFYGRQPFLVVRDVSLIKTILVKDFDAFQDRDIVIDEKHMPLLENLFILRGKRWRALRAKLTPVFTSGKMRLMYNLMEECGVGLVKFVEGPAGKGQSLELNEVMAKFTTDVIGSCAMGLQFNALDDPDCEFRRIGRAVFEPTVSNILRRLAIMTAPKLCGLLGITFEGRDVTEFFLRAVRDVVEYREQSGAQRGDLMQILMQLRKHGRVEMDKERDNDRLADNAVQSDEDINMTDTLLAAQVFVFFLAGFETSSTASSWILYELALNPDIQEKLREEVDAVLQENDGRIPYEALMSMQYLDKVWNEGLRKYPPAAFIRRTASRPYTLPGTDVTLPKNTRVIMSSWSLQHDPQHYPNPERFDPERFSEEEKVKRDNYAFLPFGEGPRMCIGMRFGVQQGKLGLAMLLAKYRFSPCEKTHIPIRFDPIAFNTKSKDGIWLTVTPREEL